MPLEFFNDGCGWTGRDAVVRHRRLRNYNTRQLTRDKVDAVRGGNKRSICIMVMGEMDVCGDFPL